MRFLLVLAVLCGGVRAADEATKADRVAVLESKLEDLKSLRDNLAAGLASGLDPARVEFPSGAVRLVSRAVLPGYVKCIEDRIQKLTIKIESRR